MISGKIYAVGLGWGTGEYGRMAEFEPVSGTWATLDPLPTRRAWGSATTYKNRCYTFGGGPVAGMEPSASVEVFNASQNKWTTMAPMPEARESHASVLFQGKIYVLSGGDTVFWVSNLYSPVRVYDPVANAWSTAADIPTPRRGLAAVALGEYIYTLGGTADPFGSGVTSNIVERYHPATGNWATMAPMPGGRLYPSAQSLGGKIYVTGGLTDDGSAANNTWIYNPQSNQWAVGADMSESRYGHATAVLDGQVYLLGGREFRESQPSTATALYTP